MIRTFFYIWVNVVKGRWNNCDNKGTVFFLGIRLGLPTKSNLKVFFPKSRKKNKTSIFYVSLEWFKNQFFIFFWAAPFVLKEKSCLVCFFFSTHIWSYFSFFSWKSFTCSPVIHSFEKAIFFFGHKKNIFFSITRFLPKSHRKQTIIGNIK